ncbi:MAG: hypothetical protein ACKOEW_08510 [Methylocystis sp.]
MSFTTLSPEFIDWKFSAQDEKKDQLDEALKAIAVRARKGLDRKKSEAFKYDKAARKLFLIIRHDGHTIYGLEHADIANYKKAQALAKRYFKDLGAGQIAPDHIELIKKAIEQV